MRGILVVRWAWTLSAVMMTASMVSQAFVTDPLPQDADSRSGAIRALIDDGRFADAEAEARRLFPAFSNERIEAAFDVRAGDLLVEALVRNGRGAEPRTRELAEEIVRAKQSNDPSLPTSLRNLGDVLFQAGEYQLATARFRESLAIRERTSGAQPSDVADDLDRLVRALTESDHYDEASALAKRAMALREQQTNPSDVRMARTLQARGLLEHKSGNYQNARADLERSLAIFEATNPSHPDTVLALSYVGEQLAAQGEWLPSRQMLTRAVSMADAALRPDHPDFASILRRLAATLTEIGDLTASLELGQRAVRIAERALGSDHVLVAMQLNDLANTLQLQGDYMPARQLYERARGIYEQRLGADFVGATTATYNLGLLYLGLGDLREARREFQRALETWQRVLGPEHPSVARAYGALATVAAQQGLDSESRKYSQRALTIRERALGVNHILVAITLSRLAATDARLGELQQASALSARAVKIFELSGAQTVLANGLVSHGQIQVMVRNYTGAADSYRRALEIEVPLLGSAHPSVAEAEAAYADVQARLDQRQDAFDRTMRADGISRTHSRLTLGYLSERQALDYAASRPPALDLGLSLMSSAEERTRVLDALVRGRALTLDEIASRHRLRTQPDAAMASLWTALTSARQRLANLTIKGPDERRPAEYATLMDEARRDKEQAERRLAEESAVFRKEQKQAAIALDDVRAALPSGSALVSFVRYERTPSTPAPAEKASSSSQPGTRRATTPAYLAFVLRADTDHPAAVPLGGADLIESQIVRWRRALVAGITRPTATPAETERAFRLVGSSLRQKLFDPISVHLKNVSRVFVVSDGAVNLVPLAALPIGNSRYLLEDGPVIHYLSAERDLVAYQQTSSFAGVGLLAVGGPAFDDASIVASSANSATPPRATPRPAPGDAETSSASTVASASFRGASSRCRSFQSLQFEILPGSRREAEDLAKLWRGLGSIDKDHAKLLVGRDAGEEAVKRLGPGNRIIHFSTHGFFLGDQCTSAIENTRAVGGLVGTKPRTRPRPRTARSEEPSENPLLFSGLAFAGANRRAKAGEGEEDGILTAEEVASLNLEGTEWAVLSACDTGLGTIKAGEGVFGLRRAFQIAGARTVIMSLWSVDDQATRTWMRALYEGRLSKQLNTADAVRGAALSMLQQRRLSGQSTHPFYWAAFVAAGDWH